MNHSYLSAMQFEWDEGNKHKSMTKHGITVEETESVWDDPNKKIFESLNKDSNEKRYICIGHSYKDELLSIIFTIRNDKIRSISSRKANKKEKKIFEGSF